MKLIKNILIILIGLQLGFSAVELSLENYNESSNTVDVHYTSNSDLGGIQFDLTGADLAGASGGAASDAGFTISTGTTTVLGFSFSGATIAAGSGLLLTLEMNNQGDEICLVEIAMANGAGQQLETTSDPCLFIGVDEPQGYQVYYSSPEAFGGFQFNIEGASIIGASGGAAEDAGFTVSTSSTTVLGFSFSGATIPAGNGMLTVLETANGSLDGCLNSVVISSSAGSDFNTEIENCNLIVIEGGFVEPVYGCTDSNACNYDQLANTDNGDCEYIADGECDCAGNVLDACGECGGTAQECIEGYSLTFGNIDSDANTIEILYSAEGEVGGFQFNIEGASVTGASGGAAEDAGFTVSTSLTTVLGFSFSGTTLPATANSVLTVIEFTSDGLGGDICFNTDQTYIAGPTGTEDIEVIIGECATLPGTTDSMTINYEFDQDVSGFQFNLTGVSATGASGGAAEDAGFTVSTSSTTVLGFSFTGSTIPSGSGLLTNLEILGSSENGCIDESSLVITIYDGTELPAWVTNCNTITSCEGADDNGNCPEEADIALEYNFGQDISGFQFDIEGADITGASGGAATDAGFTVSTSSTTVLGFSFSGDIIPSGTGVLLNLSVLTPDVNSISLTNITVSDANYENVPAYSEGLVLSVDCVTDYCGICDGDNSSCSGCMDDGADNYDADALVDDGSCEFAPVDVEEPEELEEYDSSVDIDVPEVVLEEVEVDIDIPAGALDVEEGTEVNLEVSEASENELQDIIDNSSSAGADVEVYQGISFEATDENGDPIELTEGATLDVELTFEPERNDYDLGYITDDGEIVALGADCIDNGDGTWTCAGDGPGFGSYIVYSFDPVTVVPGCTLMAACNWDPIATINDGSCTWATGLFDCDGNCTVESDCNGECGGTAELDECGECSGDNSSCSGCTDEEALNYDSDATLDDGTCEYDDGFTFTHSLGFGNNLISFPGYLENDSSQDLLEGLMADGPNVVFLLGQGVGLFNTTGGWSGNLNNIAPTSGYWINVSGSAPEWTIEFNSGLESCTPYTIGFGNNLLSYKWGSVNANTLDGLGGEEFATENFNFILGQGVGLFNTAGGWSGNLNTLEEGKGYWVNIANSNIDFKWGFDNCGDNISNFDSNAEFEKQLPEEFHFIQSTEQAFYLMKDIQVDGVQPQEGDIVLAYNNDILVGSAIWDGQYTAVPVMGKDISGLTDGFCEVGDQVDFKLYQSKTGDIVDLNGSTAKWNSLLVTHVERLSGSTYVELPSSLTLNPTYPNPFNPVTTISFGIPIDGVINIAIYDVNGRMIESLVNGFKNAGSYSMDWNADTQPSGMYFLKVQYGNEVKSEKIMLVK